MAHSILVISQIYDFLKLLLLNIEANLQNIFHRYIARGIKHIWKDVKVI